MSYAVTWSSFNKPVREKAIPALDKPTSFSGLKQTQNFRQSAGKLIKLCIQGAIFCLVNFRCIYLAYFVNPTRFSTPKEKKTLHFRGG